MPAVEQRLQVRNKSVNFSVIQIALLFLHGCSRFRVLRFRDRDGYFCSIGERNITLASMCDVISYHFLRKGLLANIEAPLKYPMAFVHFYASQTRKWGGDVLLNTSLPHVSLREKSHVLKPMRRKRCELNLENKKNKGSTTSSHEIRDPSAAIRRSMTDYILNASPASDIQQEPFGFPPCLGILRL